MKPAMCGMAVLLACVGAGCALRTPRADADPAAQRAALLGKWCLPTHPGGPCRSHEEYAADGFLRACMFLHPGTGERPARIKARYAFSPGQVCFSVVASNDEDFPIGDAFCARIVAIEREAFRYRVFGASLEDTMRRLPDGAPECPPALDGADAAGR